MPNSPHRRSARDVSPSQGQLKRPPLRGHGRAVAQYLKEIFPRPATPKEIAFNTGASYEAVKKFCRRNNSHIVSAGHGMYRYFADAQTLRQADIPEPTLHGICIVAPVSLSHPGGLSRAAVGVEQRVWFWRGRRVTMQLWSGKRKGSGPRVGVFLRCSQNPVSVPEFVEFLKEWAGTVRAFGVDPEDPRIRVRELDLAVDYPWPKVGLRGVENMTLYGFKNGLLKAYHKRRLNVLRLEACLWPVDLKPAEIERIFGELTRPLLEKQEAVVPGPPGPEVA